MMKRSQKKMGNKGFSLVELIVVIAIMAVLVVVLAPQFIKYVEQSRESSDINTLDEYLKTALVICADDDYYEVIDAADTIVIEDGSVTIANDDLADAFDDMLPGWATVTLKSKDAKALTDGFVIEFNDVGGALTAVWNEDTIPTKVIKD